jgi:hypothetical protein
MLWYFLLSEQFTTYEHRIGSFCVPCKLCQREAWQLTFRMYQTKGSHANPAGPYGVPHNERFQIRCSACGAATAVHHPSTWAPALGQGFVPEQGAVSIGIPAYVALAFPGR